MNVRIWTLNNIFFYSSFTKYFILFFKERGGKRSGGEGKGREGRNFARPIKIRLLRP